MKKPNANTTTATDASGDSSTCTTTVSCPHYLLLTAACVDPNTNLPIDNNYTQCLNNGDEWVQGCIRSSWADNNKYYSSKLCTTTPTGYNCSSTCSNSSYTGSDITTCIKDGGTSTTICCEASHSDCCKNGSKKCSSTCCELNECCSANGCYSKCGQECCESDQACINDECKIPCGESYCSISGTCISGQCCYGDNICNEVCCQEGEMCIDQSCCPSNQTYSHGSEYKCCSRPVSDGVCCSTDPCTNYDTGKNECCQSGENCTVNGCCSTDPCTNYDTGKNECCKSGQACTVNGCGGLKEVSGICDKTSCGEYKGCTVDGCCSINGDNDGKYCNGHCCHDQACVYNIQNDKGNVPNNYGCCPWNKQEYDNNGGWYCGHNTPIDSDHPV